MKSRLKDLLKEKSVIRGKKFKLSSGRTSDFYVDARITTLHPEDDSLLAKKFLDMHRECECDYIWI